FNRYRAASNLLPMSGLNPAMVPATEQSTGLKFRSLETNRLQPAKTLHLRFAASYITGAHNVKVGINHTSGWNGFTYGNLNSLSYRLNNAIPNQLSERAFPIITDTNMEHNMGVFAQDNGTIRRLTASYGLRYSYASIGWPEQQLGPSLLTPTRDLSFPAQHGFISGPDITPHLGAAYDVYGNGKTAVKVSLNRYLESLSAGAPIAQDPNPLSSLITQTTRSWSDANRDYVPDCNLTNPAANGECGAMANANFGLPVPGAIYDTNMTHGWFKRGFNWEFSAGVQHEVLPRTSVDVSYFRRTYGNARITDNRALSPSDFDKFDVTALSNPGLPGGGGYVVHGMYNLNPAKCGLASDNFVTLAKNYGDQIEYWHGVDVNLATRYLRGVLLQGGTSTGRTVTDNCALLSNVPEPAESRTNAGLITTAAIRPLRSEEPTSELQSHRDLHSFPTRRSSDLGRTVTDNCALLSNVPEPAESRNNAGLITTAAIRPLEFCHNATSWLTQVKFLGSYTIPRVDVLVSGTLQNLPGPPVLANYNLPTAEAAKTLGRPLSGGAANVSVGLINPNTVFGDRLNQVDFRVGKVLRSGRTRTTASLDLYNALNVSTILAQNNTFGA